MSTLGAARPVRANLVSYRSDRPVRDQVASAAWLSGLSLALTVIAFVAGAPPAIVPFILALGPAVIAIVLAWREGHGALRQLLRSLTILPARKRWYLALAIPVLWAFATVGVGVVLGAPTAGLFDRAFPAVLIIFLVVLLPALAEELAWRGFVLPRLMSAMSPLQAALACDAGGMTEIQTAHTADLCATTLDAAWELLVDAFEGDISTDDWEHALGGIHALAYNGAEIGRASCRERV